MRITMIRAPITALFASLQAAGQELALPKVNVVRCLRRRMSHRPRTQSGG
jgi:hypothetical protein